MTYSYTHKQAEAAMCLWEAVLNAEIAGEAPWAEWREVEGTHALRHHVLTALAPACSTDWMVWQAAGVEQYFPAFDWDFCPAWLKRCVVWDGDGGPSILSPGIRLKHMLRSDYLTSTDEPRTEEVHTTTRKPREIPVCSICGGEDVTADAAARWDEDTQQWRISSTYDKGASCDACGGETRIEWLDMKPHTVEVSLKYEVTCHKTVEVMAPHLEGAMRRIDEGDVPLGTPVLAGSAGEWGLVWKQVGQNQSLTPDPHPLGEVAAMLTLSTAHITYEASQYLEAPGEHPGLVVYEKRDYGFFIPLTDEIPLPADMPLSIKDCMNYADSLGCTWLCFDRDGPVVDDLGTYEW